jgi:hypothetical protein
VIKFGNLNQIDLIAEEVGGTVAAAPPDAQIELFDALVDGCREAVEVGNLDPKVWLFLLCVLFVVAASHKMCLWSNTIITISDSTISNGIFFRVLCWIFLVSL